MLCVEKGFELLRKDNYQWWAVSSIGQMQEGCL
jgi:hypothetical protein